MNTPALDLQRLRNRYARLQGMAESAATALDSNDAEITRLEGEAAVLDLVSNLIRSLIDKEVTDGVRAIESLQTEALQAVFSDQTNRVRADVEIKRGKVNVDLVTIREYPDGSTVEGDALDSFGGALATVQSVLLRITVMLRRGQRPFLVLDESLPAISQHYVLRMASFLQTLSERMGMDILVVTHDPLLVESATHGYTISQKDSVASFKRLR